MAIYRNGVWTYTKNDRDLLLLAIRELSDHEFRVIRMRLVELYSIEEIANELNRDWDQIDRAIERAVNKLREVFVRERKSRKRRAKLAGNSRGGEADCCRHFFSAEELDEELGLTDQFAYYA